MENRQHGAVTNRIQKLVDVPGCGKRSGFRLTVSDDSNRDQLRIVKHRTTGARKHITQLAPLVNRAGCLRCAVASDAPWKRELFEKFSQAFFILALFRIDFGVGSLQIHRTENAGGAVPGSREKDHI